MGQKQKTTYISKIYFYETMEHFDRNIFSGIDFNDQAVC